MVTIKYFYPCEAQVQNIEFRNFSVLCKRQYANGCSQLDLNNRLTVAFNPQNSLSTKTPLRVPTTLVLGTKRSLRVNI